MPSPLSETETSARPPDDLARTRDRAASRGVFHRVAEQVPEHLLQAMRVANHRHRLGGRGHVQRDFLRGGRGPDAVDRGVHHAANVDRRNRQAHPPLDHPRDVEQVLDQPRLDLGVAGNRIDGVLALRVVNGRARLQHVHPADNGVERRAQLVGRSRQELVLQVAGVLGDSARGFGLGQGIGPFVEGQVQLVEVDGGADPTGNGAGFGAVGHDARPIPAHVAGGGPKTKLGLKDALRSQRRLPARHQAFPIVGVDGLDPAEAECLFGAKAGHGHEAWAEVLRLAVGTGAKQMDGTEVGQQPELLFAHLQFRHRPRQGVGALRHLLLHRGESVMQFQLDLVPAPRLRAHLQPGQQNRQQRQRAAAHDHRLGEANRLTPGLGVVDAAAADALIREHANDQQQSCSEKQPVGDATLRMH